MTTVKSKINNLELEQEFLLDELRELEMDGLYSSKEYEDIVYEIRALEQDLEQLRRLDEDDDC